MTLGFRDTQMRQRLGWSAKRATRGESADLVQDVAARLLFGIARLADAFRSAYRYAVTASKYGRFLKRLKNSECATS